jgi:hypothetical protein
MYDLQKIPLRVGMVIHTYNLSYCRGRGRMIEIQGQPGKKCKTFLKNNRPRVMAQVVGYLPNKHKTLNSIPSTTKKTLLKE